MRLLKYSVVIALLGFSALVQAMNPLLGSDWVLKHLNNDTVVFLDIQPKGQYQRYHIPGAVNAPYSSWRTGKKQPPKGMLPAIEVLEKKLGGLGIDSSKQVVIVATGSGAGDMAAATRVFWTFRILGHEQVAVLNGGLIAYADARGKLEKGSNVPRPAKFTARPNMQLLAGVSDVQKAIKAKSALIDARSAAEFLGVYKASQKERAGTIPGSTNLPHDWLTVNGSGQIHDMNSLRKLFKLQGIQVKESRERIHFCHTGSRAALSWFVDYALLGNHKARLYDGSTQEWSSRLDTPVKAEVELW